jgi:hypothetical protein
MADELINPNKEPEVYDKRGLKLGLKFETPEHIDWRVKNQHYINFNSVSKEIRQKVLTTWRSGGISIKEVATQFNLSSDVVADILYLNIHHIPLMNLESK